MYPRYTDINELTPQFRSMVSDIVCRCFGSVADIQSFVREKLDSELEFDINWNMPQSAVCNDLALRCQVKGLVGLLLGELAPTNGFVPILIRNLIKNRFLTESGVTGTPV